MAFPTKSLVDLTRHVEIELLGPISTDLDVVGPPRPRVYNIYPWTATVGATAKNNDRAKKIEELEIIGRLTIDTECVGKMATADLVPLFGPRPAVLPNIEPRLGRHVSL